MRIGEEIRLSGSVPALGCDDPNRSIPMVTTPSDFPWWRTKEGIIRFRMDCICIHHSLTNQLFLSFHRNFSPWRPNADVSLLCVCGWQIRPLGGPGQPPPQARSGEVQRFLEEDGGQLRHSGCEWHPCAGQRTRSLCRHRETITGKHGFYTSTQIYDSL